MVPAAARISPKVRGLPSVSQLKVRAKVLYHPFSSLCREGCLLARDF